MTTSRNLTLTSILTMTVLVGATPAAAGGKADGCRQGRFVVMEGATALGGDPAVLVLDGDAVRVEGACQATGKLLNSGRKGTRMTARWQQPGSIAIAVELTGIPAAEGAQHAVQVTVDGKQFVLTSLEEFAQPLGESRWRGEAQLDLGDAWPSLGGDECTLSAPYTEATLVADENDWLTFDLTTSPVGMSGFAGSAGGLVDLTVACPGADPVASQTAAGGTWFVAPQDGGYTVSSTTFAGSYGDGATLGTTVEWSFTKVE
jgi:hypothetical protein